jgi:hypothetical protein
MLLPWLTSLTPGDFKMPSPTYSDFLDSWEQVMTGAPPLRAQLTDLLCLADSLQGRDLSLAELATCHLSQLGLVFATARARGPRASFILLCSRVRRALRLPKPVPSHSSLATPRRHPTSLVPGAWLL